MRRPDLARPLPARELELALVGGPPYPLVGRGVLVAQKHGGHAPGQVVQDLVAAGEGLPVADAARGAGPSLLLLLLLLRGGVVVRALSR